VFETEIAGQFIVALHIIERKEEKDQLFLPSLPLGAVGVPNSAVHTLIYKFRPIRLSRQLSGVSSVCDVFVLFFVFEESTIQN